MATACAPGPGNAEGRSQGHKAVARRREDTLYGAGRTQRSRWAAPSTHLLQPLWPTFKTLPAVAEIVLATCLGSIGLLALLLLPRGPCPSWAPLALCGSQEGHVALRPRAGPARRQHLLSPSESQMEACHVSALGTPGTAPGLVVSGEGCAACRAGEFCSFTINLAPPVTWRDSGMRPFKGDLMLVLAGPTLSYARLQQLPTVNSSVSTFIASYRIWEPGTYKAYLSSSCGRLIMPGTPPSYCGRPDIAEVATWLVAIRPPRTRQLAEIPRSQLADALVLAASEARGSSAVARRWKVWEREVRAMVRGSLSGQGVGSGSASGATLPGPCTGAVKARWVRARAPPQGRPPWFGFEQGTCDESVYQWTPYPCSRGGAFEDWFGTLLARGVRSMAFVGDSHVRMLMLHTVQMLVGGCDRIHDRTHKDFELSYPISRFRLNGAAPPGARSSLPTWGKESGPPNSEEQGLGDTFRFSFLWVDGVHRQGEFGCFAGGRKTGQGFPTLQTRPDILIMDSAQWSGMFCPHPVLAYATHLNEFIAAMMAQVGPNTTALFLGGLPGRQCLGSAAQSVWATTSLAEFQNEFSRAVASHYPVHWFDSWAVVAPLYHKSCYRGRGVWDNHYTCPDPQVPPLPGQRRRLEGVVGEALVSAVFQFLADIQH